MLPIDKDFYFIGSRLKMPALGVARDLILTKPPSLQQGVIKKIFFLCIRRTNPKTKRHQKKYCFIFHHYANGKFHKLLLHAHHNR